MRNRFALTGIALSFPLLFACKSELDNKPEAQVAQAPATSTASNASTAATITHTDPVIKEKSSIKFVGAKLVGDHTGTFQQFDGRVEYSGTQPAGVHFDIDLASVKTDQTKLDTHLKTADFFDVATHPKATFTSTSIEPTVAQGGGATHTVTGNLNLRGTDKTITFPANVTVSAEGVHATSEFKVNRHDWKISYPGAPDNLIKDDVLIKLDLWFPPPPA